MEKHPLAHRILLTASLLLLFAHLSVGQVVRLYTTKHGLKTNNCYSVDIDSRGFVWVSGFNTLGLFDGTRFQYLPNQSAAGQPLFQIAYGVKEAADDHYWVATSQGLYLLDARKTKFQRIYLLDDEDSIYGCAINNIIDYPKTDYKLITTDGFSTFLLNTKTLKVDRRLSNMLNEAAQDYFVSTPLIDRQHQLWVSTKETPLVRINLNGNPRRTPIDYTPAAQAIIQASTVTALLETQEGIVIGTNHGLLIYDKQQNRVQELNLQTPALQSMYITSILKTKSGHILVGTDGRGIWELQAKDGGHSLTPLYEQMADFDISYGKVKDLKEDHEGNIIAIFLNKGLAVIPPQTDCFHYHAISPLQNGKNGNCITSMEIDNAENYWIATDGCGVFKTNGMKLATAQPINTGLRSLLVQDIKIDRHGTPWAATFGGGVQYLHDGRWQNDDWLGKLSQELCMTMHYNPATDHLLVGTNGHSVFDIDITHHTISQLTFPTSFNPWIRCLFQDTDQTLWIATSSGLFHYNKRAAKQQELTHDGKRINNANAIKQDGENILIASDEGLIIYNKKTQQQQLIAEPQGLTCPQIQSITVDKENIWVSTRTNVASIDRATHTVRNFSSFSGYQLGEFHRNSSLMPGHGYILFGADNGIICFTPGLINSRRSHVHHVYFTGFSTPQHTEQLDASILYAQHIKLKAGGGSFNIQFAAAELGEPERIHYDYMLEGHEKQWHTDTPTPPQASYSSLPAGNYLFRVKAYMEDNPTQQTEATISIHVAAPWYATIWAYLAYFLLCCILAYFIYQQIRARKRQQEALRQAAEGDRIKEAKLRLFTSITHELRSPLTMIESPLRQLQEEDQNPEHQSLYAVMQRNCDRLLGIVKQITDIRKIDAGQLTLHLEQQDYVSYAERVFEQFKGVATLKEISFTVEHHEAELPMMMDTTHFEKIITNLLSNAFKFTPAGGKVIVTSGTQDGQAELRFYNSGSHFSDEDISHLWERFYQGSAGTDATGSGIGLNLVYELVKMHHGSIEVKNVDPDGVEFTLHFPYTGTTPPTEQNGHPTLLLVDDDTEIIQYLSHQLSPDYTVITALTGNQGYAQVLRHRPDVVVTDYRMPDGDGMMLCQRIKTSPDTADTPVIMLTGEGDETVQLHSLNLQADHYLEKPVNLPMLRSAINQVLRVRENMRWRAHRTAMADEMPRPVIENADDKLFSKVNESLKHHLDDSDYTVQQLSQEVGISRVHLNRKMKERYGVSPNIFIRTFRLKQAAYLLTAGRVNVSEVAYKVGFSSHSYFTTSFHDHFGMSPKEFIAYYSAEENSEALQKLLE
ncbi:MAG: response regulator [Bacteroidaceae bacterium]|nr:response regulator [Bacteroidaceae bacterium]